MGFIEEHAKWMEHHLSCRSGERRNRLDRGHGHGERMFLEHVWWPIFGSLKDLHPEYEVLDWRGKPCFIDLAWLPGQCKFAIEVKGYGPHVQNTDRTRYRRELNRETFLQIVGFRVIAIPYDDLEEQPHQTVSLLRALFSPYINVDSQSNNYTRIEREILLLAIRLNKPIRPADLVAELRINRRTAIRSLKSLCAKGKFRAMETGNAVRVCRYEYIYSPVDHLLLK